MLGCMGSTNKQRFNYIDRANSILMCTHHQRHHLHGKLFGRPRIKYRKFLVDGANIPSELTFLDVCRVPTQLTRGDGEIFDPLHFVRVLISQR